MLNILYVIILSDYFTRFHYDLMTWWLCHVTCNRVSLLSHQTLSQNKMIREMKIKIKIKGRIFRRKLGLNFVSLTCSRILRWLDKRSNYFEKPANLANPDKSITKPKLITMITVFELISWDCNKLTASKWKARNAWTKGLLIYNIYNVIRLRADVSEIVKKL